ncbi:MAG: FtsX-like permease family protein [Candidatus Dormibacteraeota bacterium]|uniref:Cell division protein FtsX n=1 Tax=Candidatus Dormiibacter inghamiae TaxID=3127013 RepID=A0A934ND84_9BACT|nr:FtsX-like permease family protein [Candidatus Dormibacteraeota bacterium]MBJ7605343.1 FtsX-like permease family protein [Candidatus Dormibacteraeota bacterium]
MRFFRQLLFTSNSGWQSFWRNGGVTVAAVLSIMLILLLGGTSLLLGHALSQVLEGYKQRVSVISVSVADGTPLASVSDFMADLRERPEVTNVRFVSKEEELRRFASDPRNQQLLQQLDSNPVPAKIEVSVRHLSDVSTIDGLARGWRGADRTNPTDYQGDFIANMVRLSNYLTIAGLGLFAVLLLISVVIVMNTIRTAVYHRRREIEVMKLVGATEWFVRRPFLIEGWLTGMIAAALAVAVLLAIYRPFVARFQQDLFFLPLAYDPSFVVPLGLEMLALGSGLGLVGSFISVRRFVRL